MLPTFKYKRANTLKEASELLSDRARVMAGGTDLLVLMKKGELNPKLLVDIKGIEELQEIRFEKDGSLVLGSLVKVRTIETSPVIQEKFPLLAQAAKTLGSVQIRNRATVGGNICRAAPSADMAPPLLALGASVRIVGRGGERTVALKDFFTGPGQTVLESDEILADIRVPRLPARAGTRYLKLGRRAAMDLAAVGVAAVVALDDSGVCSDVKIALGAVAPKPIRAIKAEQVIRGAEIEPALIREAARLAADESAPISDHRSTAQYRKKMVKALTRRAITQALQHARKVSM